MVDKKTKEDLGKDERIKAEIQRLNNIFANIDSKTKKSVNSLIETAAFMAISLEDLQRIINVKGYTEEYQNGSNQFGVKKCSEVDIYNTMIKNHLAVMKQLIDLLPKGNNGADDDGFDEFVNNK